MDDELKTLQREAEEQSQEEAKDVKVMPEVMKDVLGWAKVVFFAVAFALIFNHFVIVNATVPTGSMRTTIMEKDRIFAFRLSYLFSPPKRFDIVVFRYPDDESKLFVKRIIGLPGETVTIDNGKIYIDGSDEPLPDHFATQSYIEEYGVFVVPVDHYFMIGDNRDNSQDSRQWLNPYVERRKILGKVFVKYYPNIQWMINQ